MKCIALLGNSSVLKSNGTYTQISNIKKGDRLINMYGKPVTVTNIQHIPSKTIGMQTIKHFNWNDPLMVTDNHTFYTWARNERKLLWVQADFFEHAEQSNKVLLPPHISWELPQTFSYPLNQHVTLQPSSRLGFLFATYMAVGHLHKGPCISFEFDATKHFVKDMLVDTLYELFERETVVTHSHGKTQITLEDDILYDLFDTEQFAQDLPPFLKCTNKDYLEGLNIGFMQHLIGNFSNTAPALAHQSDQQTMKKGYGVAQWTSLSLKKPLVHGQIVERFMDVSFLTSDVILTGYKRPLEQMLYNIEVNCPCNSFIVNNMITRSE
jgi:hypothetical protein